MENSLLSFCTGIFDILNQGASVLGLFIDITKAFGFVNHSIMLVKLENLVVRGYLLDWFRNYLTDRTQCVHIDESLGFSLAINYGVPQVSVLGSILFLIYINALCQGNYVEL